MEEEKKAESKPEPEIVEMKEPEVGYVCDFR